MNLSKLQDRIVDAILARLGMGDETTPQQPDVQSASSHPSVGKFCIIRSYSAGVHAGVVRAVDGDAVTLDAGALRLWFWKANANTGALYTLATKGLNADKSKTEAIPTVAFIMGVIEIIEVQPSVCNSFVETWNA